jgi:hypothetical protein
MHKMLLMQPNKGQTVLLKKAIEATRTAFYRTYAQFLFCSEKKKVYQYMVRHTHSHTART